MVAVMNKTISGLRALVSALLLGVGFSAYAARLDPVNQHIATAESAGSVDLSPGNACGLPCISTNLEGGRQGDDAK